MAKVLVVEDSEHFREALVTALKDEGHTVDESQNGKEAKEVLNLKKFDLIISDIQMPFLNGIELLEWTQKNCPTKFILMTGFSNLLETKDAFERGADEFLSKPFRHEELTACLDRVLVHESSEKTINSESALLPISTGYCKVSIEEFVSKSQIDFDVYVQLSEKKYVKIGQAGMYIPTDQIERYKGKGISFLHIKSEDYSKLLKSNLQIAKALNCNRTITKEKKMNFIRYMGESLLEKYFVSGVDKDALKDSKEFMGVAFQAISENADFVDLIELMNAHSDKLKAQCVATSLYSIMIARKMGMNSSENYFKLSMAGLFHEVGMKEIEQDIIEKPRPLLSQVERKLIESHPIRGQEILRAIGNIPEDVIQIVLEHHEDQKALGFPRGLKKIEQHPLSAIVQLAALFSEVFLRQKNENLKEGRQIINYLEESYGDRIDKRCLDALKSIYSGS
jgi:response regulator RpfG family c-di-GMP phosphodiesterase